MWVVKRSLRPSLPCHGFLEPGSGGGDQVVDTWSLWVSTHSPSTLSASTFTTPQGDRLYLCCASKLKGVESDTQKALSTASRVSSRNGLIFVMQLWRMAVRQSREAAAASKPLEFAAWCMQLRGPYNDGNYCTKGGDHSCNSEAPESSASRTRMFWLCSRK